MCNFRSQVRLIIGVISILMTTPVVATDCSTTVDGVTFYYRLSASKATVVTGPEKYSGHLVIPSALNGFPVCNVSIYDCPALQSVALPEGLEVLGCVKECPLLEYIYIPDSVMSMSTQAFYGDSFLKKVKLSGSVVAIPDRAFWECKALTELIIPEGVVSVGDGAFWNVRH